MKKLAFTFIFILTSCSFNANYRGLNITMNIAHVAYYNKMQEVNGMKEEATILILAPKDDTDFLENKD